MTLLPATADVANGILAPQAPASQTATTAGISRADNSWWRNQYSNTSIDISTEAGRASLYSLVYSLCVRGNTKADEPDFGIAATLVLADLGAGGDTARRGTFADERIYNLGLPNIMFYNAALIRDSSTRFNNKVAFITTRDLKIKVLRPQGVKIDSKMVDENNNLGTLPVAFRPFQHDIDTLNDVAIAYSVFSLVPSLLDTHGLADNVV